MENKINQKALHNITYGLYVLTAREGSKDNGCIVNVVAQVTDTPLKIVVSVNKKNLTHDMIYRTGELCVSMLSDKAPMYVFEHFGYQSGRDVNKFEKCPEAHRTTNGLLYIPKHTLAYMAGKVVNKVDMGSHTMFVAEVTEANVLAEGNAMTYAFYQSNVKPKPAAAKGKWVCRICGYVYEGDEMPDNYICPLCKHGKADFEKVE